MRLRPDRRSRGIEKIDAEVAARGKTDRDLTRGPFVSLGTEALERGELVRAQKVSFSVVRVDSMLEKRVLDEAQAETDRIIGVYASRGILVGPYSDASAKQTPTGSCTTAYMAWPSDPSMVLRIFPPSSSARRRLSARSPTGRYINQTGGSP